MNEMLRKRMSATQQASEQQTGDGQNTAAAAGIHKTCIVMNIIT